MVAPATLRVPLNLETLDERSLPAVAAVPLAAVPPAIPGYPGKWLDINGDDTMQASEVFLRVSRGYYEPFGEESLAASDPVGTARWIDDNHDGTEQENETFLFLTGGRLRRVTPSDPSPERILFNDLRRFPQWLDVNSDGHTQPSEFFAAMPDGQFTRLYDNYRSGGAKLPQRWNDFNGDNRIQASELPLTVHWIDVNHDGTRQETETFRAAANGNLRQLPAAAPVVPAGGAVAVNDANELPATLPTGFSTKPGTYGNLQGEQCSPEGGTITVTVRKVFAPQLADAVVVPLGWTPGGQALFNGFTGVAKALGAGRGVTLGKLLGGALSTSAAREIWVKFSQVYVDYSFTYVCRNGRWDLVGGKEIGRGTWTSDWVKLLNPNMANDPVWLPSDPASDLADAVDQALKGFGF